MKVFVRSGGFLASVQDVGRTGFRQSGVSLSGALDPFALRVANALVKNEEAAAGVEATFGNLRLRFEDERLVAWCGGGFVVRIGEEELPPGRAGLVIAGEELVMAAPKNGSRAWLAISGGIDVAPVLGSRSTDLRGKFGGYQGRTLLDGDSLALGRSSMVPTRAAKRFGDRRVAPWTAPLVWSATEPGDRFLRFLRGQDWSRFTSKVQASFAASRFEVSLDSDRMGVRLDGPTLERIESGDLLSEAVSPGTIQVPPNGQPILLLGDCQTIGGYPKIAHVITVDLPISAQLFPGDVVRFHEVSLADAQELLREREEEFALFRVGLDLQLG